MLTADAAELLRRARREWADGCNCAVCFAIDRYERGVIGKDSLYQLLQLWIDENGPKHDGSRFWSKRRTDFWS